MNTDLRCKLCGRVAQNSIVVWGATIVGCPCVPERVGMIAVAPMPSDMRRYTEVLGRISLQERANHDPDDEDRSER